MTDLIDRADSGEIPTEVIDLDGPTRNLTPYFRRPDSTGEQPLYEPSGLIGGDFPPEAATLVITTDNSAGVFTPNPPEPRHAALDEPVAEWPVLRAAVPPPVRRRSWWGRLTYAGQHRAARWTR